VRFIDSSNQWAARIGIFAILVIMLVGSMEVVARGAFNSPTHWAWELNQMLLCFYIVLAGGYTVLVDGHVRMDIFYGKFSARVRALVNLALSFLFFAFVVILLWYLSKMGWYALTIREHAFSVWHPPLYPLKMLLPVAVLLVLLQGIATFIRNINTVIKGEGAAL